MLAFCCYKSSDNFDFYSDLPCWKNYFQWQAKVSGSHKFSSAPSLSFSLSLYLYLYVGTACCIFFFFSFFVLWLFLFLAENFFRLDLSVWRLRLKSIYFHLSTHFNSNGFSFVFFLFFWRFLSQFYSTF